MSDKEETPEQVRVEDTANTVLLRNLPQGLTAETVPHVAVNNLGI